MKRIKILLFLIKIILFTLAISCKSTTANNPNSLSKLIKPINQMDKVDSLVNILKVNNFVMISIEHSVEYYLRSELNYIYVNNGYVKIHSVVRERYETKIDTLFELEVYQRKIIDGFLRNINQNKFPQTGPVFAGTRTVMKVLYDDNLYKVTNQSDYSLYEHLIKEPQK